MLEQLGSADKNQHSDIAIGGKKNLRLKMRSQKLEIGEEIEY